jgi:hypothetical protein
MPLSTGSNLVEFLFYRFSKHENVSVLEKRMSVAALSPEGQIERGLTELGCAGNSFAEIAGIVSKSRFAQGLAGRNDFDQHDAVRMLEVLNEMVELREMSQSPPDWRRTEEIRQALEERRRAKKLVHDTSEFLEKWKRYTQEKT